MNIIFIAPPAAGKGTISKFLVDNYDYIHLSTGDMLRKISKEDTPLGNSIKNLMKEGKFISDDIMFTLIKNELANINGKPFILDGMPRNINQAKYLDQMLKSINVDKYIVINIDINKDILKMRATGRRLCQNCGASYNIYFDGFKPKVINTCDKCNSTLIQRDDDSEETFKYRYETYLENTLPVINYYKEQGLLRIVDASKSASEIECDVVSILKGEKND
jgi:adenylate kinase